MKTEYRVAEYDRVALTVSDGTWAAPQTLQRLDRSAGGGYRKGVAHTRRHQRLGRVGRGVVGGELANTSLSLGSFCQNRDQSPDWVRSAKFYSTLEAARHLWRSFCDLMIGM